MANEPTGKGSTALKVLPAGQEVERAGVTPDGTVMIAHARGKLVSVDIADVDLLLSFSDGSFVIVPNGALDALGGDSRNIVFTDTKVPLAQVFKMAGIANPAKAGSLRLVSEAIDSAKPPSDEAPPSEETIVELPAPPAPMVKVSAGTSLGNKGVGKGPGAGGSGSGEGEGEVPATVVPLQTPTPPVFRVGQKREGVLDYLEQYGFGQPSFTAALYTSDEFKVTPSGRVDAPLGAYVAGDTAAQLTVRASPERQATREVINGSAADDVISHNAGFSADLNTWHKVIHVTFNNFSELSAIEIVVNGNALAIPGFNLTGEGVSKDPATANRWIVTPNADMLLNGKDIVISYTVPGSFANDNPIDFGMDITTTGKSGPIPFEITNNYDLSWREAVTMIDFQATNSSGETVMVLPRSGMGVEVFGNDGNDTVSTGAGHDLIHGGSGNDNLDGGRGNDTLNGGSGADILTGGLGADTATYYQATTGVTATLDLGISVTNTNEAAGDTYDSIENLTGSDHDDILIGKDGLNILLGGGGNDILIGRGDADTLDGGDGIDTASYRYASSGVTVTLTVRDGTGALLSGRGEGKAGEADGDVLTSIENLTGSEYSDTFTGAAGVQANVFDGRGGIDTVSYQQSSEGVVAVLNPALLLAPLTQTNDAAGDSFIDIENLTGTQFNDTLVGNAGINALSGGAGNDVLEGLGGADSFFGGEGTDTLSYANSQSAVVSSLTTGLTGVTQSGDALGDSYDSIENMVGTGYSDTLIGSRFDNRIEGGRGDDILEGMGGADALIGGLGDDTASYAHSRGVIASLTVGIPGVLTSGDAGGDTYDSIENLTGSEAVDTLIGNAESNILDGGAEDDILEGMGGADTLIGGDGLNYASYQHASAVVVDTGVTASLIDETVNTGDAAGDHYVLIQHLMGSAYNDTLTGNNNYNRLEGGDGNDTLSGLGGLDVLLGEDGDDTLIDDLTGQAMLYGGYGDDTIRMTSADAVLDIIDGGPNTSVGDTLVWAYAGSNLIYVNLYTGSLQFTAPVAGTANFSNIENFRVEGTNSAYVYADNNDNVITGSVGYDYVDYRYALRGIYVNLATGIVTGGSGNDTLSSIEAILYGSQWDDVLIGNASNNNIRGWAGSDYIDGGAGIDLWYIDETTSTVTASLLTATQNSQMGIVMSGVAAGDTVVNMEYLYAANSLSGSMIYGNESANGLYGNGLLEGFIGADYLYGWSNSATASYANAGNTYLAAQGITTAAGLGVTATLTTSFSQGPAVVNTGDAAGDTYVNILYNLTGSAFADTLIGSSAANTLTGGDGDDLLEGLSGADFFSGGNGSDTVSFAHSTAGVTVDLQNNIPASNDAVGDIFISIENLTGSNFNDELYGNLSDNILVGGLGNDRLDGAGGFDTASYATASGAVTINLATGTVTGAAGTDTLIDIERIIGSMHADTIIGSSGDDVIDGGAGQDTIQGGDGADTVSYASATGPRAVNLANGANTDNDGYDSIENIIGSIYGDVLTGSAGNNVIEGGLGADSLDGDDGMEDTASYAGAMSAVRVSLAISGAQDTGGAGTDTLSNFENLLGSNYNDTLTGDANANVLTGGAGNDTLIGGAGADSLIGGQGTDTASYATATAGVTATINGVGSGGDASGDVLSGIEDLIGSDHDDTLTGDGGSNVIVGGGGNDILNGQGGIDTVSYAGATAQITVSLASLAVQNTGGAGSDSLQNFENIIGSAHNDTLTGDGGANTLAGGSGADSLDGGEGNDTASYADSAAGVAVSLVSGAANTGGDAAGDTLTNIENLIGSAFNDTLTGSLSANTLEGGAGDDILIGGAGADFLIGGTGNNTASYSNAGAAVTANLTSGSGTVGDALGDSYSGIQNLTGSSLNDTLTGNTSDNLLDGGLGNDTLSAGDGNDILDVRLGRDTASGGNGDDTFWVDASGANLPTLLSGDGNISARAAGGDAIKLFNLGGTYSLTALANVTNSMEILDIRDGNATTLSLASADIRNFNDAGNPSEIWVRANSGDTISFGLVSGETMVQNTLAADKIDYTIYNASAVQVGQIHWQVA